VKYISEKEFRAKFLEMLHTPDVVIDAKNLTAKWGMKYASITYFTRML